MSFGAYASKPEAALDFVLYHLRSCRPNIPLRRAGTRQSGIVAVGWKPMKRGLHLQLLDFNEGTIYNDYNANPITVSEL